MTRERAVTTAVIPSNKAAFKCPIWNILLSHRTFPSLVCSISMPSGLAKGLVRSSLSQAQADQHMAASFTHHPPNPNPNPNHSKALSPLALPRVHMRGVCHLQGSGGYRAVGGGGGTPSQRPEVFWRTGHPPRGKPERKQRSVF